jgi:hypothetical protein
MNDKISGNRVLRRAGAHVSLSMHTSVGTNG